VFTSWRIARILGIDVYIHWSFWLLLIYILLFQLKSSGWSEALNAVSFVIVVFGCVLLHEFGHALMALRFGAKTRDITLLPIGGVARIEQIPTEPRAEFLIAAAGPAVNVVIASVLFVVLLATGVVETLLNTSPLEQDFLKQLLVVNLGLIIFNMIPAFPMDGGRILRSFLARKRSHLQATETAVRVGRWFSIALIIAGIVYTQLTLIIIGLFMIVAGFTELLQVRAASFVARNASNGFPFGSNDSPMDSKVVDAEDFRRIE
jgi:Zn-dependent protease